MKHTLKKVLSLVLVAMLLVSAIPFQASASTDITVVVKYDDGNANDEFSFTPNDTTNGSSLENIIKYQVIRERGLVESIGDFVQANWGKNTTTSSYDGVTIEPGMTVSIRFTKKATSDVEPTTESSEAPTTKPTEAASKAITLKLLFNDSQTVSQTLTLDEPANGKYATIRNLLKYVFDSNWESKYTFYRANNPRLGTTYDIDSQVLAGEYINVRLKDIVEEAEPIKIVVKVNDSDNVVWEGSKVPANKQYSLVSDLLTYCWNGDWDNAYTFHHAWSHEQQRNVSSDGKIYAGDTVYIMVTRGSSTGSSSGSTGNTGTNKFPYKVYLHIYLNNKVDEPAKDLNITSGIAADGYVDMADVKNVVKQYYTAKTSDGIGYDGLYLAQGNWVSNFVNDYEKLDAISGINEKRQQSEVHINVMITNAVAKSSSTSSSTNPKTGDNIGMTVAALGVTASALAAAYYVSKKRAVR